MVAYRGAVMRPGCVLFSVRGWGLATKNTGPATLFFGLFLGTPPLHNAIGGWAGLRPEGRTSTP